MAKKVIIGDALPGMPWEDRPAGSDEIVWRSKKNPIITRDAVKGANSIFNSAVVPYEGAYTGVFRVDHKTFDCRLHVGRSRNGYDWDIEDEPIRLICEDKEIASLGGYDPRVIKLEDKYYVCWCNAYHGPTIGVAWTKDFKSFHQLENAFLPFNRNGVLFPKKINGKYAMLSRPSDNGHTPFGDIFYSESPDLMHWGCHRHVMQAKGGWSWTKIGPGPVPIETSEGWLLIYHGVLTSCSGYVYRAGAAILDKDKPWKVLYRAKPYILGPQELYENVGDVPNVCFPCATLQDAETGRLAMYYGAADTVVALAFLYVHELLDFIKKNPL